MPAAARKDLYLSVDGGVTSAFTAAMKAGRSTLADFGKSADLSAQAVRDAFTKLGGGDIANAAKAMEASFNSAFASIRANAKKVVDAPTPLAAFDILSAQATREAVANAELRVDALRQVAAAARTAATGDASGDQRAYAVAAEANVVAAERIMATERAKLGVLEAVEAQMRANGLATREEAAAEAELAAKAEEAARAQAAQVERGEQLLRSVNPLYAAQKRYQETLALTAELEAAGALSAARAAEVRTDAMAKLNAVNDADVRAANAEQEAQALREASLAYQMFEARVREGVQAMRETEAEEQRLAQAAARIRAEVDPAWAAQQRFDREMGLAQQAVSAGALSLDEYCAKLRIERAALEEGGEALHRHAGAFGGMGIAGMEAEHVVRAFTDSIASGQAPLRALGMELPRVSEALMFYAQTTNATEGAMGKLTAFMGGPWGLAFTAAVAIAGPLVEKLFETNDALGDAIKKLNDDAAATRIADEAHRAFSRTIEGEIETQKKLNEQLDHQIMTQRQQQQFTLYSARQSVTNQENSRPGLVQGIADQERTVADYQRRVASFKDDPKSFGATAAADRLKVETTKLEQMRDELKRLDASIASGQFAIREAEQPLLANDVAASMDKKAAATRRYEIALGRLNFQLKLGAGNSGTFHQQQSDGSFKDVQTKGISEAQYSVELRGITKVRDDAIAAITDAKKTARDNQQSGRTPTLAEAENIVTGIGGRITSTTRSTAEQSVLYDRYVAYKEGRGPWAPLAAKPGTSEHERGQALDIAMTPGMSLAKITEAFRAEGIHLTERLVEGNHYHVAWGAKGPSQETLARRAHTAEVRDDNDDRAFQSELGGAQGRLGKAQLALADTAENRLAVELDDLRSALVQRDAEIDDQVKAGKISAARGESLKWLNQLAEDDEEEAAQRKTRQTLLDQQLAVDRAGIERGMRLIELQSSLAHTASQRHALALRLLALEEEQARAAANRKLQSDDKRTRDEGAAELAQVDAEHPYRVKQIDRQDADPVSKYKLSLQDSVGDMNDALKGVEADGLKGLENGLLGVIDGTKSAAAAFKQMATSIVSDIARIAVEKLILSVVGLKDGGPVLRLADGGAIFGEGGPRDDKVPALLSHGEYVINAAAYARHPALVQAINTGRLPRFADGGAVGPIFYPELPSPASIARPAAQRDVVYVQVDKSDLFDVHVQRAAAPLAQAAMIGGATQARQDLADQSMARIPT